MADFLRVGFLFLALASSWLAAREAHAYGQVDYQTVTDSGWEVGTRENANVYGFRRPTAAASCSALAADWTQRDTFPPGPFGKPYSGDSSSGTCVVRSSNGSTSFSRSLRTYSTQITTCPAGSGQLPGGECECFAGLKPGPLNTCVIQDSCTGAAFTGTVQDLEFRWTGSARSVCYQGCTIDVSYFGVQGGQNVSVPGYAKPSGTFCQGDGGTGNTSGVAVGTPAVECKPGEFPGQINGVNVCVPGTVTADGPATAASAPASGASAPSIPGAPAGTTSTSESTSCTGTRCTTTTTFRNSSGQSLGTLGRDESLASLCDRNPSYALCAESSSSFGGSCGAFTCSGDAVQCAIAKSQHDLACSLSQESPESTLYGTEKNKPGVQVPDGGSFNLGPSSFDTSSALGPGACITDLSVMVMGQSLSLPFSQLCPYLAILGNVLVAISLLIAARIVVRG